MAEFVLVVANGEFPSDELFGTLIEQADFTIALDGAADRFEGWDVVIGDLDSIENREGHEAMNNQNDSDLAKALKKYDVDAVVGIAGGRLDHQLQAYTSLVESNSDAILYLDGWRACRIPDEGLNIELKSGSICALFALGPVESVTLTGCEFEMSNENLNTGTKGVGNSAKGGNVEISHAAGDLLFIWSA
jgi:thiamine pyrophosphokinase